MNKFSEKAPKGITYMSEWLDYRLPEGHCIVDKGVTGCGYTEYCLRNDLNIVLCSPRKLLLENKAEQHVKDQNILYVKNDVENYKGARSLVDTVKDHVMMCQGGPFGFNPRPCKLMVTYDSAHYVIDALQQTGDLEKFYFVVDEFQSIFLDSFFKSEVEFDFVEYLSVCPNVIYLSATPMLDKYLEKVDEFKDLNFYHIDWSETGIIESIVLKRKFTTSLSLECQKVIDKYKRNRFDMRLTPEGKVVVSNEAVFYLNSIGDITQIIRKAELTPGEVNIICANTKDNQAKIRRMSKDMGFEADDNCFQVGRIPLKGEPNKMFTFCTKTAYIGADFHSSCASSFVFADPNIDCLALDISLDLPQIVGRQRDRENPFKNEVVVFYRTLRKEEMEDREAFDKKQALRKKESKTILEGYAALNDEQRLAYLKKLRSDIKVSSYQDDFVSISKKTGLPIYNYFLEIANERAWDVSQKDYQDKVSVTKALEEVSTLLGDYKDEVETLVADFLERDFYSTGIFRERMKRYCRFMDLYRPEYNQELEDLIYYKIKDDRFRRYYNFYGTRGCSARSYQDSELAEGLRNATKEHELFEAIHNKFKIGNSYTLKEIKFVLENMYRDLGIVKKAKATDLGKYFTLIRVYMPNPVTQKRSEGYRLASLLHP